MDLKENIWIKQTSKKTKEEKYFTPEKAIKFGVGMVALTTATALTKKILS